MAFNTETAKKAQQASVKAKRSKKEQRDSVESFLSEYFSKPSTHKEIEIALNKLAKAKHYQFIYLVNQLMAYVSPRKSQVADLRSAMDLIKSAPLSEDQMLEGLKILNERLQKEYEYA